MMLQCMDLVSCSWLCVGVQCANICFCDMCYIGCIFQQMGPKLKIVTKVSFLLHATIPMKKKAIFDG